ncbi:MAG: DUF29 family protein, partial [Stellaceae bacterium]
LEHSPAVDPRNGWRRTVRQARAEIDRILEDSPSLRREVSRLIREETGRAVQLAVSDMEQYDEIDRLELPTLRKASYTDEQVLGDWLPEEPRG